METFAPATPVDPVARDLLLRCYQVISWIVWPIWKSVYFVLSYTVYALTALIRLVLQPIVFLLQPIIYFGRFVFATISFPFRFLARFETVWIYLGVAALTGLSFGLALSIVSGTLQATLGLDSLTDTDAGRTAKQYRTSKRKDKARVEAPLISAGRLPALGSLSSSYLGRSEGNRKSNGVQNLVSQTIMEEMDSDY